MAARYSKRNSWPPASIMHYGCTDHSAPMTGCSTRRIPQTCTAREATLADLYSSVTGRWSPQWPRKGSYASGERLETVHDAIDIDLRNFGRAVSVGVRRIG